MKNSVLKREFGKEVSRLCSSVSSETLERFRQEDASGRLRILAEETEDESLRQYLLESEKELALVLGELGGLGDARANKAAYLMKVWEVAAEKGQGFKEWLPVFSIILWAVTFFSGLISLFWFDTYTGMNVGTVAFCVMNFCVLTLLIALTVTKGMGNLIHSYVRIIVSVFCLVVPLTVIFYRSPAPLNKVGVETSNGALVRVIDSNENFWVSPPSFSNKITWYDKSTEEYEREDVFGKKWLKIRYGKKLNQTALRSGRLNELPGFYRDEIQAQVLGVVESFLVESAGKEPNTAKLALSLRSIKTQLYSLDDIQVELWEPKLGR